MFCKFFGRHCHESVDDRGFVAVASTLVLGDSANLFLMDKAGQLASRCCPESDGPNCRLLSVHGRSACKLVRGHGGNEFLLPLFILRPPPGRRLLSCRLVPLQLLLLHLEPSQSLLLLLLFHLGTWLLLLPLVHQVHLVFGGSAGSTLGLRQVVGVRSARQHCGPRACLVVSLPCNRIARGWLRRLAHGRCSHAAALADDTPRRLSSRHR